MPALPPPPNDVCETATTVGTITAAPDNAAQYVIFNGTTVGATRDFYGGFGGFCGVNWPNGLPDFAGVLYGPFYFGGSTVVGDAVNIGVTDFNWFYNLSPWTSLPTLRVVTASCASTASAVCVGYTGDGQASYVELTINPQPDTPYWIHTANYYNDIFGSFALEISLPPGAIMSGAPIRPTPVPTPQPTIKPTKKPTPVPTAAPTRIPAD